LAHAEARPSVRFTSLALPLGTTNSSPGPLKFMIQKVCVTSLALLVLFSSTMTFSQQKDRNRKSDAAQKNTSAASESSTKDDKNEGDPLLRGMKYRSIGPFRGGRSLTAAGIPGDPSTYYFGATGGGVWK